MPGWTVRCHLFGCRDPRAASTVRDVLSTPNGATGSRRLGSRATSPPALARPSARGDVRHPFFALTRPTGARADRGPVYGGRPGQPCREPRRPWPRGSRAQLDGSDSWRLLGRLGSGFVSRPRVLSTSGWRGRHLGATGRARGAAFAGRPSRGPPSGAGRRCWRRREARARRREPPPRRSRARSDRRRKPLGTAPHRPLRAPFAARLRTPISRPVAGC